MTLMCLTPHILTSIVHYTEANIRGLCLNTFTVPP